MKILEIKTLAISEIKVIRFARFCDHRGYFTESYNKNDFSDIDFMKGVEFLQANESYSKSETIRGLHFQWDPYMGKLIRVQYGHMVDLVLDIRKKGDTAGGVTEVIIRGVPAGLGEPVFDKLSADLAKGIMSIGACKGVEIGGGFKAAKMTGSEWNDEPYAEDGKVKFRTNNQGGILGGISTGQDIVLRVAVKPTPTISIDQSSVNMKTMENSELSAITRRDASLLPRIYPVIEAMTRCVVLDHLYMWRAWCGMQKYENKWRDG